MDKLQCKRIIARHRDSLNRYGYSPQALYWSSRAIQELRFKALAAIGIQTGDSVLDVGCGFGDFKTWAAQCGIVTEYSGVDLSTDLLEIARQRHGEAGFYCGELLELDFAPHAFDWTVLSGVLNEQLGDKGAYARKIIARMQQLSRKGTAFNLLSCRDEWTRTRPDLQSFDPQQILAYCRGLGADCLLIDDYLANDFTIHMHTTPKNARR